MNTRFKLSQFIDADLSYKLIKNLQRMPSRFRRILFVFIDSLIIICSEVFSFWLSSSNSLKYSLSNYFWLLPFTLLIGVIIYLTTGQYNGLTKYIGGSILYKITFRNIILISVLIISASLFDLAIPSVKFWILLLLLLISITSLVRFIARDLILIYNKSKNVKSSVIAIYGAGSAGARLAATQRFTRNNKIIAFLDDQSEFWGRSILGIPIKSPKFIEKIKPQLDKILLAIPSLNNIRRKEILENLERYELPVFQVPSIDDLISGKEAIDTIRPIDVEDILGRDSITPDQRLLGPGITNSVVCITGAGGSIGSELCLEVLNLNPSILILIEQSELSLYNINQKLIGKAEKVIPIIPILGNVMDKELINNVFQKYSIDILIHSAAYKHVPLVEANPLSGVMNNVISTRVLCKAAVEYSIKNFLLISTDKAVRPTNIMGASKRLSELIVQAFSIETENKGPIFSMVRFGNVLGSSGSVVPLFSKQIAEGGPITLTHKNVIRYFMTIKEAAQLVLQASVMADGGDVFLFDMGKQVKIYDLACQMIHLSGLTVKDSNNQKGDIEIITTGLRPGEKLYEELLIDAKSEPTMHPLIFRATEKAIPPDLLWPQLDHLENALVKRDEKQALLNLSKLVTNWSHNIS